MKYLWHCLSQFDFFLAFALIAGGSRLMPHATCLMPYTSCRMANALCNAEKLRIIIGSRLPRCQRPQRQLLRLPSPKAEATHTHTHSHLTITITMKSDNNKVKKRSLSRLMLYFIKRDLHMKPMRLCNVVALLMDCIIRGDLHGNLSWLNRFGISSCILNWLAVY